MKLSKNAAPVILALLLAACVFVWFTTRDTAKPIASKKQPAAAEQPLIDTHRLDTAVRLSPLAATADEQAQAREAWRLADHELDLTFAAALRNAEAEASAALPARGPLRELSDRIAKLKASVEADKKRVDALGKDGGDALDLAQAQLDLDQDELDDAQQDLAREGGDRRGPAAAPAAGARGFGESVGPIDQVCRPRSHRHVERTGSCLDCAG